MTDIHANAHISRESQRFWQRFRRHRVGYWSLWIFLFLYGASLAGDFISNDKPLLVKYEDSWYFPILKTYPDTAFGGRLPSEADYHDPYTQAQIRQGGGYIVFPPNPYYYDTLAYYSPEFNFPAAPSANNIAGTDIFGYDMAARLLYGFRVSVTFALALTLVSVALGIVIGAVQGYFAGRVDLIGQRLIEIWASMPELYLLIIFASVFNSSFLLIFTLLALFSWMQLGDYVRAEFLRNRELEYVKAARALGLSDWQIMVRHVLPNSLTPVITFIPFRISAGIMALASLDFLGLGVSAPAPSLGNLLSQGKENLDAWWISLSTFSVLVLTLLLLTFIGEALRDALDTRLETGREDEPAEEDDDSDDETAADHSPRPQPQTADVRPFPAVARKPAPSPAPAARDLPAYSATETS